MAWIDTVTVTCKNKICNDGNTKVNISRTNGHMPDPLPPCPECGFKTLDQYSMTSIELENLLKAFEKTK